MKRGMAVEFDTLNRAVGDVADELGELGIYWGTRLEDVDVYWCRLLPHVPSALGFFTDHKLSLVEELAGYVRGHIYVPRIVPFQFWNQCRGSVRGIVRHEMAHALAFYYPHIIRVDDKFYRTFGGWYDDRKADEKHPVDAYISEYARTNPSEDFAETFEFWVTNRNNRRIRGVHRLLARKFEYIERTVSKIANLKIH